MPDRPVNLTISASTVDLSASIDQLSRCFTALGDQMSDFGDALGDAFGGLGERMAGIPVLINEAIPEGEVYLVTEPGGTSQHVAMARTTLKAARERKERRAPARKPAAPLPDRAIFLRE